MESQNVQLLNLLLTNAGLAPPLADREQLLPMLEIYLERLKLLHLVDLDDEEVSGEFNPLILGKGTL